MYLTLIHLKILIKDNLLSVDSKLLFLSLNISFLLMGKTC